MWILWNISRLLKSIMGLNALIDGIVDVASKNGVTLLGVAPRADGTFPESQVETLNRLGDWMKINKTALHGTEWHTTCEAGSLRFTRKGRYLYAIDLEQPSAPVVIPAVTPEPDSTIRMLGSDKDLTWHREGGNVLPLLAVGGIGVVERVSHRDAVQRLLFHAVVGLGPAASRMVGATSVMW
ncbi:MAG: alpha-L-fucosidase [Candidatus Nealsonbacteria bacterium]|nr:alpha-L-fucosidase [Candidatus Nealsonbacteria bacterium]